MANIRLSEKEALKDKLLKIKDSSDSNLKDQVIAVLFLTIVELSAEELASPKWSELSSLIMAI